MPSIKQSLSLMSIILASLVWVPHAAVLAQEKTEDIPSNGNSDPDPDSSSRDESQTVGTANDYGHFDIELLRVRLVENEFVSIYRDAPMQANNTPSGRVSPVTSGNTAGNDIYRLKIPANQTAVFLGSGKPISIELFRQLFAENDIPVIITSDPQKLFGEFSGHISLDAVILHISESALTRSVKLDRGETTKIENNKTCVRNQGTLTHLNAIVPQVFNEEVPETYLSPVTQTRAVNYSVQVPVTEQIPYTVTVPIVNNNGEKVMVQQTQMRTVTRMRTETRTREVTEFGLETVTRMQAKTKLNYICGIRRPVGFQEQAYTVTVPYTEQVEQTYTVMEPRTESYEANGELKTREIRVPVTKTRMVPVTRQRSETRTRMVWDGETSVHIVQQSIDNLKNVRMATVDISEFSQADAVNETEILMTEFLDPCYGALFDPTVIHVPGYFFDQYRLLANAIENNSLDGRKVDNVYLGPTTCFIQQSKGEKKQWSVFELAESKANEYEELSEFVDMYHLIDRSTELEIQIPKNGGHSKIKNKDDQWNEYVAMKKVDKKVVDAFKTKAQGAKGSPAEPKPVVDD